MQTKKTAPSAQEREQALPSEQPSHVLAELEFRQFNPTTGDRISKPFQQYYTPIEWSHLQEHGPRMGLFLNKVIEAPEGTNVKYNNPK